MLIGLTGKTGSGKSSAAQIFEKLGAFTVDCDVIAHEVLFDDDVKNRLVCEFSDAILNDDGTVNRKKLGNIVFSDCDKLSALNSIMHKAIIDKALKMCEASDKDIAVIDGSEIESSGLYKKCNYVVVITADDSIRLKRILSRDNIDRDSALLRMSAQKDYSHEAFVISNNGNAESLKNELSLLYNKFWREINDADK